MLISCGSYLEIVGVRNRLASFVNSSNRLSGGEVERYTELMARYVRISRFKSIEDRSWTSIFR